MHLYSSWKIAEFVVVSAKLRNETCTVHYHVCLSLFIPRGKQSGEKEKIFLAALQNKDITSSCIRPFINVEHLD